jgi:AcrR family transcriptional regulator
MSTRHETTQQTRVRVLEAAYELWLANPFDEVTLESIAETAGVTRQTIHRQFGSKDDLFVAVVDWRRPAEQEQSQLPDAGDVATAVRVYVDRYERMGDALVRFLAIEGRIEAVDHLLAIGRAEHTAELEDAFGALLPPQGTPERDRATLALYGATDVMVWKLLRRDLGRSREETELVIRQLVEGVLCTLAVPQRRSIP